MSRLDNQLVNEAVDKILAYSRGETLDGVKGKQRNFVETIDLQVRGSRRTTPGPRAAPFRALRRRFGTAAEGRGGSR
jgi:hypothetical protein